MKVLIVGSGGREHAIAASVAKSPRADKIYCAPGNAGIAEYAECVDIGAMEFEKLAAFAKEKEIDLCIVGMVVGCCSDFFGLSKFHMVDCFRSANHLCLPLGSHPNSTGSCCHW